MNITEANAVNVVLRRLFEIAPIPDEEATREAAQLVAERANKALGAGLRAEDIWRAP